MAKSDFIEYFDKDIMHRLGARGPTMRAVIREALHKEVQTIFETGCMREVDNWLGDGQSTQIWSAYKRFVSGSDFTTCNIDEDACRTAESACKGLRWYCMDSIKALRKDSHLIDLLYLDSIDVNMAAPHEAALYTFMEFCAAIPRLHAGSIVFIDDSPIDQSMEIGGKGKYVASYFQKMNVMPFTFGYQVAWIVPEWLAP